MILTGEVAFADWCDPISRYEIRQFESGSWIKYAYTDRLYDKLHYYHTFAQLEAQTFCSYNNTLLDVHLDNVRKDEADFVFKSVASSLGNEILKSTNLDDYLYFKFRFDFDAPRRERHSNKNKEPDKKSELDKDSIETPLWDDWAQRSAEASNYLLDSVRRFSLEDDIRVKILLGETIRLGLSHSTHYVEPGYNLLDNRISLTYSEWLETRDYHLGVISVQYTLPEKEIFSLDGYLQVRYSIVF